MNTLSKTFSDDLFKFVKDKNIILSFDSTDEQFLDELCDSFSSLNQPICTKPFGLKDFTINEIVDRYNLIKNSQNNVVVLKHSNSKVIKNFTQFERDSNLLNLFEDDIIIELDEFKHLEKDQLIEKITSIVVEQIKNLTHYDLALDISRISKDFFGDNLKYLIWAGSSGKAKHINAWSDIDVYMFLGKIPHKEMMNYTNLLKDYDFHIDTTFYDARELKNLSICERAIVTLSEAQEGTDVVLHKDSNVEIPYVPFERLKKYTIEELLRACNDLKRQMYVSQNNPTRNDRRFPEKCDSDKSNPIFNVGRILKAQNLTKKLLLRLNGIIAKYANEVDYLFCQYILKNIFTDKDSIEFKNFVNNFAKYSFNEIIKRKNEQEVADYVVNQGFALLELMEKFEIVK